MKCKCGFTFIPEFREGKPPAFPSFALIDDEEYTDILDLEFGVREATDEKARAEKFYETSQRIGSAKICPNCGRVSIRWPGQESEFYTKEKGAD